MTVMPAALAASYPREPLPPKWVLRFVDGTVFVTENSIRAATIDEGATVSFTLQVTNALVGSRMILWMANNAPGTSGSSLINDASWLRPWYTVMQEALVANGFTVRRLSSTTTPKLLGQMSLVATVTDAYVGQTVTFTNTVRRNRTTEKAQPRYAQLLLESKVDSADSDTTGITGGNILRVRDTSQNPAGAPTLSLQNTAPDGVSPAKTTLNPGDGVRATLVTQNMLPGTKVKLYIANAGQNMFAPSFRSALIAALKAMPPGISYETTSYPPPAGEVWYNGATVVFDDDYSDANPFTFTFLAGDKIPEDTSYQFDVIAQVVKEGTAADFAAVQQRGDWNAGTTYANGDVVTYVDDGGRYILIASSAKGGTPTDANWRPYIPTQVLRGSFSGALKAFPPRYWEIRATSDGSTISYALQVPIGADGDNVALASSGTVPPGFGDAMVQAFAAHPEIANLSGGRITAHATDRNAASIAWTVPHPGSTPGKHGLTIDDPVGASPIVIADACVYLSRPARGAEPRFVTGVNLSGGEFGKRASEGGDRYAFDYRYQSRPEAADASKRHQVMDYHWAKGARIIRVPFLWGRIQDEPFAPIAAAARPADLTGTTRADGYRLDELIAYWTGLGGYVLLDLHNFGNGPNGGKVGYDQAVSTAALADLWAQIAARYAGNPRVWLGLMNEPNGSSAWSPTRTRDTLQAVVNAIRLRTDAQNRILVAASEYSSAQNFISNGQADAFASLYDPADNLVIELHSYFDKDASGTNAVCVAGTDKRLDAATAWAKQAGRPRLFLGECAGSDPTVSGQEACGAVLPAIYQRMTADKGAWAGWTTWGGGDLWGASYIFNLEPASYADPVDRETMKMLAPYLTVVS